MLCTVLYTPHFPKSLSLDPELSWLPESPVDPPASALVPQCQGYREAETRRFWGLLDASHISSRLSKRPWSKGTRRRVRDRSGYRTTPSDLYFKVAYGPSTTPHAHSITRMFHSHTQISLFLDFYLFDIHYCMISPFHSRYFYNHFTF